MKGKQKELTANSHVDVSANGETLGEEFIVHEG